VYTREACGGTVAVAVSAATAAAALLLLDATLPPPLPRCSLSGVEDSGMSHSMGDLVASGLVPRQLPGHSTGSSKAAASPSQVAGRHSPDRAGPAPVPKDTSGIGYKAPEVSFATQLFLAGRPEGDFSGGDIMSTLTAITGPSTSSGWEPSTDLVLGTDNPSRCVCQCVCQLRGLCFALLSSHL
jgi:hypothetical protein